VIRHAILRQAQLGGPTVRKPNKTFHVKLRTNAIQHVRAATFKIYGDHLVFLTAEGRLAALFLLGIVDSWNEIEEARI
jgi:hypothetical protein